MSDKSCLTHRLQTDNLASDEKTHKEEVKKYQYNFIIFIFYSRI
jgi:hypothetical protein